jgi:hypothetical protein
MNLSNKQIIRPANDAFFTFDPHKSDCMDPTTGKKCITISINGMQQLIPTGEPVEITEEIFQLFQSIGGYLPPHRSYDPIRKP